MTHATADALPFRSIGIVGCGLIGCSIAAALKQGGFPGQMIGCGRSGINLDVARKLGYVDSVETELARAAPLCDLLIVCTPVDRIVETVRMLAAASQPGTLFTDAGSVKQSVCESLRQGLPPTATFIGSHPIAGSERQGCTSARADLFVGHVCVITPEEGAPRDQVARLTHLWQAIGMTVVEMSAEAHDRALAQTSHLPHVVAAALAATLSLDNARLTAGGFQDTTRIAAGDPALWTGILLANAVHVSNETRALRERLQRFQEALESRDGQALHELLSLAKSRRDAVHSQNRPADGPGVE